MSMQEREIVPGRPLLLDKTVLIETILQFKDNLVNKNGKVVSRFNPVWNIISKELNSVYKGSSLWVMVKGNKYGLMSLLGIQNNDVNCESDPRNNEEYLETENLRINPTRDSLERSYDSNGTSNTSSEAENINFEFFVTKTEFDDITIKKYYTRNTSKGRKKNLRLQNVFKPGVFQEFLGKKIFDVTSLSCAFMTEHTSVNMEKSRGVFTGHCKCGSKLKIIFKKFLESGDYVADCELQIGNGKCGKYYLRASTRTEVGRELVSKSVHLKRAEFSSGKWPNKGEPPNLFSPEVLHQAKKEYKSGQFLHPDIFQSLLLLKFNKYPQFIGDIGFYPFFVHYTTNEQRNAYEKLRSRGNMIICIDSTGSVVTPIPRDVKVGRKHVFLHSITATSEIAQFTVAHMLSEESHAQCLSNWILTLKRSGFTDPIVIVTDWSRALLNAVSMSFTEYKSIVQYSDAFINENIPKIYIRIDVSHTLKKYSVFFKNTRRVIKTLFLATIGEIIKCQNLDDVKLLLEALFVVSLAETEGLNHNGSSSVCQKAKEFLLSKIADIEVPEEEIRPDSEALNDLINDQEISNQNYWYQWGYALLENTKKQIEIDDTGLGVNAHHNPPFAKYILKDLPLLPLWTNIFAQKFGFTERRTFSTGAMENEHNKLKNLIFRKDELPLRADVFIEKHLNYLLGNSRRVIGEIENNKAINKNKCEVCKNVCGSKMCILCEKYIHTSDECSIPCEDDTNNKICKICFSRSDSRHILALRTFDNWKNFGNHNRNIDIRAENQSNQRSDSHCPSCGNEVGTAHSCISCRKFVHAIETCSVGYGEEGHGQIRKCRKCADEQPESIEKSDSHCPSCGNEVGTAHSCISCRKFVHAIEICSVGYGEEGHGQMRKCRKCCDEQPESIEKQKNQNKRNALYLGDRKNHIKDILTLKKHHKIPVIKNGNSLELKPIKIDGKDIVLRNTCAIDSLFQIILCGCHDIKIIDEKVQKLAKEKNFFEMVRNVKENGLGQYSYQLRAHVLAQFHDIGSSINETIHHINCNSNVGALANQIFAICPSYEETWICEKGCLDNTVSYASYSLSIDDIFMDFENIITKCHQNSSKNTICQNQCDGLRRVNKIVGDIVILEIFRNLDVRTIKIGSIPTYFQIPGDEVNHLKILGLVNYRNTRLTRKEEESEGHYTAVVRRSDKTWTEYDDVGAKTYPVRLNTKVQPALIILYKEKIK